MISLFKSLHSYFDKKISSELPLMEQSQLNAIIKENRESLRKVPSWVNDQIKKDSFYNYGIPDNISALINLEIGDEVTYTDLIVYLCRKLKSVNYLELGVSVGKNFFQVANQTKSANLTGFDIENINPLLERHFSFINETNWPTKPDSVREQESYIKTYKFLSNKVNYMAGDIWDENCWKKLNGNKYNVIFSDALHDPKALVWEYAMIEKYALLDNDFLMFWDDLNNGLEQSFYKIAKSLKQKFNLKNQNIRLIKINGWLGQNYPIKHDVGIVTNLFLE